MWFWRVVARTFFGTSPPGALSAGGGVRSAAWAREREAGMMAGGESGGKTQVLWLEPAISFY